MSAGTADRLATIRTFKQLGREDRHELGVRSTMTSARLLNGARA
jgi:hypothetical protein